MQEMHATNHDDAVVAVPLDTMAVLDDVQDDGSNQNSPPTNVRSLVRPRYKMLG